MTFDEAVYSYLLTVPKGRVVTYGMIALAIGHPRAARQVGSALHRNPRPGEIPCHRVVNREGRLAPAFAFGGQGVQKELLEREGVPCELREGLYYVDLSAYGWRPETI